MTDIDVDNEVTPGEVPAAITDWRDSWSRILSSSLPENRRDLLRRAAAEVWQILEVARTHDSKNYAVGHQAAMDGLYDFAVRAGFGDDAAQDIIVEAKTAPIVDEHVDEGARPPEFSDEALALRFAERNKNTLRYVAAWGKWLVWDGHRWLFDDTLWSLSEARQVCREASKRGAEETNKPGLARSIASAKTVCAVERLARADRRCAATIDQFDADPWLLNTPAGVVDLRTSNIRQGVPADYITKTTGIAPAANCSIDLWLAFLKRITGDNPDLIAFLARMVGYALTGHTSEGALFFLYGTGANGKSTFVNTITGCIGEYHTVAPIETFTVSKFDGHPTDLAGLRGARLVTATETEEGRRWNEAKIKALTGGDEIAARFMRQDFFKFRPVFKLVIAGNHKPGLRSVDEAIRRRFHLVPFTVTIPADERDKDLTEKLKAEWPGILHWMIDGSLAWQRDGLAPPQAVTEATGAYLEAEDALAAWIEEETQEDRNAFELSKDLFKSWTGWAERSGEYVGSEKRFSLRLEERAESFGITKQRDAVGRRGFRGRRLRRPVEQTVDDREKGAQPVGEKS